MTSGKQFQFMNGNEGVPLYSIMYYDNEIEDWTEGGKYNGMILNQGLQISAKLAQKLSYFPSSRCNKQCDITEAKQYPRGSCCWLCTKCAKFDIVQDVISNLLNPNMLRPQQQCKPCPMGTTPNSAKTECLQLETTYSGYSHPHIIPVVLLSSLGLVMTTIFAIIYIIHRDTPIIKASGRETGVVLLAGITLSYTLPLIMMLKPHLVVCIVIRISPGLCFTMCYAAILAKTNRIARIFQVIGSNSKRTKFTSPVSQMYIIGSMIAAEIIILLVGIIVELPTTDILQDNTSKVLVCTKVNAMHLTTGLSFPVVLLILATLYAFRIRKVPDGFNESRMLAFVNYANCTTIIILLPVMFVLDKQVETGVVLCYGLQLSATAELLGLFLPKIYIALFRPEKNTKEAIMFRTRSQSTLSYANNLKFMQIEARNSISSGKGETSAVDLDEKKKLHRNSSASSCEPPQIVKIIPSESISNPEVVSTSTCNCACKLHKNVSFSEGDHGATSTSTQSSTVTARQGSCRSKGSLDANKIGPVRLQNGDTDSGYSELNTTV